MEITIRVNEKQAAIINRALDLYARIGAGQFREILFHPQFFSVDKGNAADELEKIASQLTGLPPYSYHGITSEKLCKQSKTAFWIHQHIRYVIAWARNPEGGYTVDFNKPEKFQEEEPVVVCEAKE